MELPQWRMAPVSAKGIVCDHVCIVGVVVDLTSWVVRRISTRCEQPALRKSRQLCHPVGQIEVEDLGLSGSSSKGIGGDHQSKIKPIVTLRSALSFSNEEIFNFVFDGFEARNEPLPRLRHPARPMAGRHKHRAARPTNAEACPTDAGDFRCSRRADQHRQCAFQSALNLGIVFRCSTLFVSRSRRGSTRAAGHVLFALPFVAFNLPGVLVAFHVSPGHGRGFQLAQGVPNARSARSTAPEPRIAGASAAAYPSRITVADIAITSSSDRRGELSVASQRLIAMRSRPRAFGSRDSNPADGERRSSLGPRNSTGSRTGSPENTQGMDLVQQFERSMQVPVPDGVRRHQSEPCYLATTRSAEPRRDRLRLLALRRRRPILTWFHRVSWPFESRWGRKSWARASHQPDSGVPETDGPVGSLRLEVQPLGQAAQTTPSSSGAPTRPLRRRSKVAAISPVTVSRPR